MENKEIRSFKSEVKQLLNLVINSLYSNKEIFLRELISNASDAAEKLRFKALSNTQLYEDDSNIKVRIILDKSKKTITISDNGIGMTKNEVIENLGSIAKSGTKSFLESIQSNTQKDNKLIGQFGVGFYSSFIVSKKVIVITRAAGLTSNEAVFWESSGEGDYIIADTNKEKRGTDVILHIRENEIDFLNDWKLRSIINKYSDHISIPIEMKKINTKNSNISWEMINKAQALWRLDKSDISDENYKNFYKNITHDTHDPLIWSHNHVEGKNEYISLLYIPSVAPWDIWNRDHKYGIKLYIQRVFIMEEAEQFLPNYLRFVKGLIDCNNLSLNISREILQDNFLIKQLRNSLTKRVLNILQKLSKNEKDKYQIFWNQFGLILKEGPAENDNKELLINLLRFSSTYSNNSIQDISLDDYISRMKSNQKKIYYITADSFIKAKSSPHLEIFNKNKIEVLLLSDRIDEWMMSYITEYNGKPFQSVSKSDNSLDEINNIKQQKKICDKNSELFITRIKKILINRVKDVRTTYRLTNTPAVVTTDNNEMSTQMVKLLTAAGQKVPPVKYIFEFNPEHFLIKYISNITNDKLLTEWIEIIFDQSILVEFGTLDNPNIFINRINNKFKELI